MSGNRANASAIQRRTNNPPPQVRTSSSSSSRYNPPPPTPQQNPKLSEKVSPTPIPGKVLLNIVSNAAQHASTTKFSGHGFSFRHVTQFPYAALTFLIEVIELLY